MSKPTIPPKAQMVINIAKAAGWAYHTSHGRDRHGMRLLRLTLARQADDNASYCHAYLVWRTNSAGDQISYKVDRMLYRTRRDGAWEELHTLQALIHMMRSAPVLINSAGRQ